MGGAGGGGGGWFGDDSRALHLLCTLLLTAVFPGGSDGKASAYNAGDLGLIPGLGRSPGEGNDNPLQYSFLENPMDGGAYSPQGHKESDTTERLNNNRQKPTQHYRAIILQLKANNCLKKVKK